MTVYVTNADIDAFAKRIGDQFPLSKPRLKKFPSGAFMLDVTVGSEVYVVEYLHGKGWWGVSKQSTAVFGWEGFENSFDTFEETERFVVNLLQHPPLQAQS